MKPRRQRRADKSAQRKPEPEAGRQSAPNTFSRRMLFSSAVSALKGAVAAARTEATTQKKIAAISRRGALARAGLGLAAIYGVKKAAEALQLRIPFWAGAERRNELTIAFQRHDFGIHAAPLLGLVDSAAKGGRPFHVFLKETAVLERAEFENTVRLCERNAENYRKYFSDMRRDGLSVNEAKSKLIGMYLKPNPQASEFNAVLETELALRRIPIVPIEAYSAEELVKVYSDYEAYKKNAAEIDRARAMNVPLLKLQEVETKEAARLLETTNMRNRRIAEQLPFLFREVKRLFPGLARETQLRALGSLGSGHRKAAFSFDFEAAGLRVNEAETYEKYSLMEFLGRNAMPYRAPNEKDSRLMALVPYVDGNFRNLARGGREDLARKAFQRAVRMTQKEFAELSNSTAQLQTTMRMRYIMNYLLGEQYYRVIPAMPP